MKDNWGFCPVCGARKGGDQAETVGRDLFSEMFNRVRDSMQDFDDMDKLFEKNIEALDISPWFRKVQEDRKGMRPAQGGGFRIHITSGSGGPPKVSIKAFGDAGKESLENGAVGGGSNAMEARQAKRKIIRMPSFSRAAAPKTCEEPRADVRRIGGKVAVEMCLPGVRSDEDIEVKDLESSVEVKAIAGERAYFKILTKPEQFRLTGRSFSKGVLHLEFS